MARSRSAPPTVRRPRRLDLVPGSDGPPYLHVEVEGDFEHEQLAAVHAIAQRGVLADRLGGTDPFAGVRAALARGRRAAVALDSLASTAVFDEAEAHVIRIEDAIVAALDVEMSAAAALRLREALDPLLRPESPADGSEAASGPEDAREEPS